MGKTASEIPKRPRESFKLVVVDDEEDISLVLEQTLLSAGYQVEVFNDALDAVAFLLSKGGETDLVVTDINMPDLDGLGLMQKVREVFPQLAFVIMTGVTDVSTGVQAMKLGAYDYVNKPLQTDLILKTVEKALEHSALLKENLYYQQNLEKLVQERTSELEESNSKLDEAYRQLLQADKLNSLGMMAGTLAHDISSPMQVISSIGKSWLERYKTGMDPEDRTMFERSVNKIVSLIRTVQNFVRSGDQACEIPVRKLVEDTLLLSSKFLAKNNVRVTTEFAEGGDTVYVKPNEIEQVFTNLIHNAVHAMERNLEEKRLWIKTVLEEAGKKPVIEISIRDNGHGVNEDNLERVFDSFFTTKPTGKGTGLGLSICRRIVTEHDGTIRVESSGEEGATFFIRLPAL